MSLRKPHFLLISGDPKEIIKDIDLEQATIIYDEDEK